MGFFCELNANTAIDSLALSLSFPPPPQQMRLMEVLIVCSSGIDYSIGGGRTVSPPLRAFFHMNYYALYFLLNMHCVPLVAH